MSYSSYSSYSSYCAEFATGGLRSASAGAHACRRFVSLQTPVCGNAKSVSIGFCTHTLIASGSPASAHLPGCGGGLKRRKRRKRRRGRKHLRAVAEKVSLQTPASGNAKTVSIGLCTHTLIASGAPASAQGGERGFLFAGQKENRVHPSIKAASEAVAATLRRPVNASRSNFKGWW